MAPPIKLNLGKEELENLYNEFGSKNALGEHLGVSGSTVMRAMRKHGIELKKPLPKKFFVTKEELQAKYDELNGMQVVAEHYGVSKKLIMNYMNRFGIIRVDDREPCERMMTGHGYVLLYRPEHPGASQRGYVLEHRLVMEEYLGHAVHPDMVVHHDDEDRENNCIDNLVLMTNSAHMKLHAKRRWG